MPASRIWLGFAMALIFAPMLAGAVHAAEAAKTGAVGDSYVLVLEGNPSTGYRWQFNAANSENPAIVRVEDLGYGAAPKQPDGKLLLGAPQPYRLRISLQSAGSAKLVFEYVRPWEGKPVRTFEQRVEVRGK